MHHPPAPLHKLHSRLTSHSGGLTYHLRALRHRKLWAPFAATVADWLSGWRPDSRRLVIVGPSGGYALPMEFLLAFERITVLEPDPLARWLLARRFPAIDFEFQDLDCLADEHGLEALAACFPSAAFLFANVLGQIPAPGGGRWAGLLASRLAGREWASWHDAISTDQAPRATAPRSIRQPAPLESVLAHFWPGGELALTDHDTFALGSTASHDYAVWQLLPGRYHLVEWHTHRPHPGGRATSFDNTKNRE